MLYHIISYKYIIYIYSLFICIIDTRSHMHVTICLGCPESSIAAREVRNREAELSDEDLYFECFGSGNVEPKG